MKEEVDEILLALTDEDREMALKDLLAATREARGSRDLRGILEQLLKILLVDGRRAKIP